MYWRIIGISLQQNYPAEGAIPMTGITQKADGRQFLG
jgi:hypothetical protein